MRHTQTAHKAIIAGLVAIFLTGCGATKLNEREIVNGIFFEEASGKYYVTLVTQKKQQGEQADSEPYEAYRSEAESYEAAWYTAESKLEGNAFYGLTDVAVLPAGATWEAAEQIGGLLYNKVSPMPEISVFLAEKNANGENSKKRAEEYAELKNLERQYAFHWGIETLFEDKAQMVLPCATADGYASILLQKGKAAQEIDIPLYAQLYAVLAGHCHHLQGPLAPKDAAITAQADCSIRRGTENKVTVCLVLSNVQWTRLAQGPESIAEWEQELEKEIRNFFAATSRMHQSRQADPFHLGFYQKLYSADTSDAVDVVVKFEY